MSKKIKHPHHKQRQRQRTSQKRILIAATALLSIVAIILVIYFNISQVKEMDASAVHITLVSDQQFTTEKSLPAPVILQRHPASASTIFIRQVKALPVASSH